MTRIDARDTEAARLEALFAACQQTYRQRNGRYWQGLRDQTKRAGSQVEGWENMPKPTTGYELEVHEYDGPRGRGYVLILHNAGQTKSINVGPESFRSHDWREARS